MDLNEEVLARSLDDHLWRCLGEAMAREELAWGLGD